MFQLKVGTDLSNLPPSQRPEPSQSVGEGNARNARRHSSPALAYIDRSQFSQAPDRTVVFQQGFRILLDV